MSKLVTFIEVLTRFFAHIAGVLVITLSLLILYQAINRYLFNDSSVLIQELQWHIFDIIFLLGLSYTLQTDKHVRVDIFYASYSQKTKAIINIISQFFLILPFVIIILYTSQTLVEMSYLQGEISSDPGGLTHRYLIKAMILVGFALLGLQSIAEIYKNIMIIKEAK
ncbi:MAG TPA: TRAP transporter small permease subunit [Campylobacterales bacterium]|nr:TRAP transporter small permease subunit [Campylobacterales bacterium]